MFRTVCAVFLTSISVLSCGESASSNQDAPASPDGKSAVDASASDAEPPSPDAKPVDPCAGFACDNGGTCSVAGSSPACECLSGFHGVHCEIDDDMRLTVASRMFANKSLTLRADLLDPSNGILVKDGCFDNLGTVTMTSLLDGQNVPVSVTIFDDHLPVPDDSIRFYHGIGSVSITLDNPSVVAAGNYKVTVTFGERTASRIVQIETAAAFREMPATLIGTDLVWGPNENIHLTQHATVVPAGSTLKILPGTLVMIDTTGALEDGTLLNIEGNMEALGTIESPIHFFSERGAAAMTHIVSGPTVSNPDAWRGIFFFGAGSSKLQHVMLTGAGNGSVVSHPRPPIFNIFGTHNVTVEDSTLVDCTGMMFQSPGTGTTTIRRTLVSRVGIGAEFLSSGNTVLIEDSWWTGIGQGPTEPLRYDGDGIHLDGIGSTQIVRRSVIADIGDDGIDHSNSNFTVENTMIHDAQDKAISMKNGEAVIRNVLIFNASTGIRGAANVSNSTISVPNPIATPLSVRSSIIWPQTLDTCAGDFQHSIVGDPASLSCGVGNQSVDPGFVDPLRCDYGLTLTSPAQIAGPGGETIGYRGW
jgi:hypothetical protein